MRIEISSSLTSRESARTGEYTISDLARIHGLSLRTLRFYEDKGLLHPRRQGTARFYSPVDRIHLQLILKGKRLGFTLAEIHELIVSRTKRVAPSSAIDESSDLIVSLGHEQILAQIAYLERQRGELDEAIEELRRAHDRMLNPAD